MTSKSMMKLAASSLLLGTAMVGTQSLAEASPDGKAAKAAEQSYLGAQQAIGQRQGSSAVRFAEAAVAASPSDAHYRMTLGQAYLLAGRFASAAATFSDVLTLDPSNARAAVSLSLAQTALGRNGDALATLDSIHGPVEQADLGLARTLAGDAHGGITTLIAAARAPGATPKTRQNLALSFALAGMWSEARTVAAQDISPAAVDQRIAEWARFTAPTATHEQVATLLGVRRAADPGVPTRLALVQPVAPPMQSAAAIAPVRVAAIITPVAPAVVPVRTAVLVDAPAARPSIATFSASAPDVPASAVVATAIPPSHLPAPAYAPKRAVHEHALAALTAPAAPRAVAVNGDANDKPLRRVALTRPATGKFVVQLGAFSNVKNVELAWGRARGKLAHLASYTPSRATFSTTANNSLYRLSVGGFSTRVEAVKLCEAVRSSGGQCFVRGSAGDAPVQWVSRDKPTRLASR